MEKEKRKEKSDEKLWNAIGFCMGVVFIVAVIYSLLYL